MLWIGASILKGFEYGQLYSGTVVSYDSDEKYYTIHYVDGDEEEMDTAEVIAHLDPHNITLDPVSPELIQSSKIQKIHREGHPVIDYFISKQPVISDIVIQNILRLYKYGKPEYDQWIQVLAGQPDSEHIDWRSAMMGTKDWYNKGNGLEPNMSNLFVLHYFLGSRNYNMLQSLTRSSVKRKEAWKTYLELFWPGALNHKGIEATPHLRQASFFSFDDLGSSHEDDLDLRATLLVNHCLARGIYKLHVIDGHGRLVVRIVKLFHDANRLNELDLRVYNIAPPAHLWQLFTLPYGAACDTDIMIDLKNVNTPPEFLNDKVFYFNFSGLCNQGDYVVDILTRYKNTKNLFVSFANSQRGKIAVKKLLCDLSQRGLLYSNYHPITQRSFMQKKSDHPQYGDFVTLGPEPNPDMTPTKVDSEGYCRGSLSQDAATTKKRKASDIMAHWGGRRTRSHSGGNQRQHIISRPRRTVRRCSAQL